MHDRLDSTWKYAAIAQTSTKFVCNVIVFITSSIVLIILIKRGDIKRMARMLAVTLYLVFATTLILSILYVSMILNHDWQYRIHDSDSTVLGTLDATSYGLILAINWVFSSHYLRVASLIKLTFSRQHSVEAVETMRRRQQLLRWLDITVLVLLALTEVFLFSYVLNFNRVRLFTGLLSVSAIWLITLVSLFSIRHIQRISAQLKDVGISAN